MKRPNTKYVLCIILFFALVFQIKKIITNIQTSDLYSITCNELFAPNLINQIKDFINSNLQRKKPQEFSDTLKTKFPLINKVIIQRQKPDLLKIIIEAQKPVFLINNKLVFTNNNQIFNSSFFKPEIIDKLEHINTFEPISDDFKLFLNKLPPNIASQFNVIWKNKNHIILKEKSSNLIIIIKHDLIPTTQHIKLCKKIKSENQNDKIDKDFITDFITDLRFTNQIVVCKE
jgi:hypothetical protein